MTEGTATGGAACEEGGPEVGQSAGGALTSAQLCSEPAAEAEDPCTISTVAYLVAGSGGSERALEIPLGCVAGIEESCEPAATPDAGCWTNGISTGSLMRTSELDEFAEMSYLSGAPTSPVGGGVTGIGDAGTRPLSAACLCVNHGSFPGTCHGSGSLASAGIAWAGSELMVVTAGLGLAPCAGLPATGMPAAPGCGCGVGAPWQGAGGHGATCWTTAGDVPGCAAGPEGRGGGARPPVPGAKPGCGWEPAGGWPSGGCMTGGATVCPRTAACTCGGTAAKLECPEVSPAAALEACWTCQPAEGAGCG